MFADVMIGRIVRHRKSGQTAEVVGVWWGGVIARTSDGKCRPWKSESIVRHQRDRKKVWVIGRMIEVYEPISQRWLRGQVVAIEPATVLIDCGDPVFDGCRLTRSVAGFTKWRECDDRPASTD